MRGTSGDRGADTGRTPPLPCHDATVRTVGVVITAFDQGELVATAVASARAQTRPPCTVVVVDDGSTDAASLGVLDAIGRSGRATVLRQANAGVSAARNAGIAACTTDLVLVLDGDDAVAPTFVERTAAAVEGDDDVVAASSWLHLHGVVDAVVRPSGGTLVDFLHRNASPATSLLRRDAWERCGGYDETMRDGFEDWDLFLSLLAPGGRVAIVPEALVEYRTACASANVRSMDKRLALYATLVAKHRPSFERHLDDVLLALEGRAVAAAGRWEDLVADDPALPVGEITYGDGGMAAAVRIATRRASAAATPQVRDPEDEGQSAIGPHLRPR